MSPRHDPDDTDLTRRRPLGYWVAVGLIAAVVLGAGGYGAYRYLRLRMEGRNLARASALAESGDFRRAQLLLDQAVQVNPDSLPARRALAEFLDRVGSPVAFERWKDVAKLAPDSDDVRLRLAESALRAVQLDEARTALASVSAAVRDTVDYHRAAAALALLDGSAAGPHYKALVRLEPANLRFRFQWAAHQLGAADPAAVGRARLALDELARGPRLRIRAVLALIEDAPRRWPGSADPVAELARHLLAPRAELSLQPVRPDVPRPPELIAHAMAESAPAPQDVAVLATWLTARRQPEFVLQWLDTLDPHLRVDPLVVTVTADAAAAASQWDRLRAALERGGWGLVPPGTVEGAFRVRAAAEADRAREWAAVLDASLGARSALRLLARLAGAWEWSEEAERTLRMVTRLYPEELWAWSTLAGQLIAGGRSEDLWQLYDRWARAAPGNTAVQLERAILAGVLGRTASPPPGLARDADATRADSPGWTLVRALELRAAGRIGEARDLLASANLPYAREPRFALLHGVILSEAGSARASEELLSRVGDQRLLPEEEALLRAARARNRAAAGRR